MVADISLDDIVLQENETVGAILVTADEYIKLAEKEELCKPSAQRYYNDILKELQ